MPLLTELALAAETLPAWVWYVAGAAHGVLLALYLPGAVAWVVRHTDTEKL